MRFKTFFYAAIVSSAIHFSPANAQTADELAQKYINLPMVQEGMDDMFSPATMVKQLEAMTGGQVKLSPEQATEIGTVMSNAMSKLKPDLQKAMVTSAAANFTPQELMTLMEFYQSPNGASIMKKMPAFQQQAMTELGPKMQQALMGMMPQIQAILTGQPAK